MAAEEAATTITRLADSEINGIAVAVFESSVDMGLFGDHDNRPLPILDGLDGSNRKLATATKSNWLKRT